MKRLVITLLCFINCIEGRIFSRPQKHPKHNSPIHINTDSTEIVQAYVTSKKELRASFDTLTNVGYMTYMQRWITYLWKGNAKESEAQERLEKELMAIKKGGTIESFIDSVQGLQKKLGVVLDTMNADVSYIPAIIFYDDGSIMLDDEKYTFAQTVFANAQMEVEQIEAMVSPRLIAQAQERFTTAQDRIIQDPIPYFVEGGSLEDILVAFKNALDIPGAEVKELLETLFKSDKKLLLKLHPDRNRDNQDNANHAFVNYNVLKSAYNNNLAEWNEACAKL